jgi:hypothetical protein
VLITLDGRHRIELHGSRREISCRTWSEVASAPTW